jgi:hypothetical protein
MSSAGADPSSAAPASSAAAAGAAAAAAAVAPASSVAAAAAGAGPSSAAPASSAAAAAAVAGAPAGSVFVKRSDDARARFAPVEIFVGDAVGHLAKRASLELNWRTTAAYMDLFLVSTDFAVAVEGGDESAGIAAKKLFSGASLAHAGVSNGAFLLARLSYPPEAAPGDYARARAARSILSCSSSRGGGGARGTCERFRWGLRGALTLFRPRFHSILRRRRRGRWRWQQRGCSIRQRGCSCIYSSDLGGPRAPRGAPRP